MKSTELASDSTNKSRRQIILAVLLTVSAVLYTYHLGRRPLGASEAYSALAASQPSIEQVAGCALRFDPGKPVLYHLLLHGFVRCFGTSETSLRLFSALWGVASVWLVYALATEWFGPEVGLAAAVVWAFNPMAVVLAHWARMYSMFIALVLAHLLAMARLRRDASVRGVMLAGFLGAAMLYTHFGAVLILGADSIVIVRDFRREGKSVRWPALAIAILLFLPFVPVLASQSKSLLFGHWLDWIGTGQRSLGVRLCFSMLAGAVVLWLTLAADAGDESRESFQRCLIYAAAPVVVLIAASVAVRPVFSIRYVSPSIAIVPIALVYGLDRAGKKARNLGAAALAAFFLFLSPLYSIRNEPWPQIAETIAKNGRTSEPIFFESGFCTDAEVIGGDGEGGFADGFFRVPFDYYFHRSNPRAAVPTGDGARSVIEARLKDAGGAWLVSGRPWPNAVEELPHGPHLRIDLTRQFSRILVFHLTLAGRPGQAAGRPQTGKRKPARYQSKV